MENFNLKMLENSVDVNNIEQDLFDMYNVKKGLRNEDRTGVLVGLTRISDVYGYYIEDGKKIDDQGHLYYRGIDVFDIVNGVNKHGICGFEETCFLILYGKLPTKDELDLFRSELSKEYVLPDGFLEVSLLRYPSKNIMNKIQRALLMLYSSDENPDDTSVENIMKQGLSIIGKLPAIICYSYQGKAHHFNNESLYIHHPQPYLSIAENILYMMRPNKQYTKIEAEILDLALIIHADHGGGNNSTFTNSVMSSSGTDLYSSIAGAVGSLKGPRHGGANIRVIGMMNAIMDEIGVSASEEDMLNILEKIYNKDFFDNSGLIYGIGHAIYTKSDPRTQVLKERSKALAIEKGKEQIYQFYTTFERVATNFLETKKGNDFNVCANVDFYSGFVYKMLELPPDIYTPLFVASRMIGWLAHTIENKLYCDKIIRPATKYVGELTEYIDIEKRGK